LLTNQLFFALRVNMNIAQMKSRLSQYFTDAVESTDIEVVDLTGTEDHWQVLVKSSSFQGLTRIQAHQKVMSAFAEELKTGEVHALTIKTFTK
jgi:stress-induced morphogen